MTDLRVNAVGEIDRGRHARKGHDLSLRSERVDLVRIEVDLDHFEELAGILRLLLPLEDVAEPRDALRLPASGPGLLLVLPVGCDTLLRDPMHLVRPDLYLEGVSHVGHDGGVEGLV